MKNPRGQGLTGSTFSLPPFDHHLLSASLEAAATAALRLRHRRLQKFESSLWSDICEEIAAKPSLQLATARCLVICHTHRLDETSASHLWTGDYLESAASGQGGMSRQKGGCGENLKCIVRGMNQERPGCQGPSSRCLSCWLGWSWVLRSANGLIC